MEPKHPVKRDLNEDAYDVVKRATAETDELPVALEEAWADWSKRIRKVDERTRALLRAAFEAGIAAAKRNTSAASELGRLGASKGGDARAASLTSARRKAIAKKAAKARWQIRKERG